MHPEGDRGDERAGSPSTAQAGPSETAPQSARERGADPSPAADNGASQPVSRKARKRRRSRGRGKRADQQASPSSNTATGAARPRGQGNRPSRHAPGDDGPVYGALDLGTNNCRLLIARRSRDGFRVVDAFSRIVRLGEGLSSAGRLGDEAMDRAVEALRVCADKMARRGVTRSRLIATQACRIAGNGADFIERVKRETGLSLEIVSTEDEARLAVAGCAPLLDRACTSALVFDIGGGSTELIWVNMGTGGRNGAGVGRHRPRIEDWTSLPCGVVTLAERHGGIDVPGPIYDLMVDEVSARIAPFMERLNALREDGVDPLGGFHLLGTSGTVTTIAGVHLGLPRYDRNRVDGVWITPGDVHRVTRNLLTMKYEDRAAHPCVGRERADLVLAGCAIFEAISRAWPAERLRVADRGLREGILLSLMDADAARGRRRRRRSRGGAKVKHEQAVATT
ncbi:MAG TPA: Ppx/GppA phosphatase family protein [Parvibaculum sp.]|uniref:Ppx/GppA phosphatase family protein n=1 Tax=Parvibaculum sp. TaxID=2024848 RepID=UPI002BFC9498|nr:Ppx/GppA phosphatase family protein [Parvibaculum sp.]HMM15570.1 Ppx/GppA phosphatase family protein [Parvibaculum sp.]